MHRILPANSSDLEKNIVRGQILKTKCSLSIHLPIMELKLRIQA